MRTASAGWRRRARPWVVRRRAERPATDAPFPRSAWPIPACAAVVTSPARRSAQRADATARMDSPRRRPQVVRGCCRTPATRAGAAAGRSGCDGRCSNGRESCRPGCRGHRPLRVTRPVRCAARDCKRRGICPSCGARRMAQTAAHLVDHVIPRVPVRQWVRACQFRLPITVWCWTACTGATLKAKRSSSKCPRRPMRRCRRCCTRSSRGALEQLCRYLNSSGDITKCSVPSRFGRFGGLIARENRDAAESNEHISGPSFVTPGAFRKNGRLKNLPPLVQRLPTPGLHHLLDVLPFGQLHLHLGKRRRARLDERRDRIQLNRHRLHGSAPYGNIKCVERLGCGRGRETNLRVYPMLLIHASPILCGSLKS